MKPIIPPPHELHGWQFMDLFIKTMVSKGYLNKVPGGWMINNDVEYLPHDKLDFLLKEYLKKIDDND